MTEKRFTVPLKYRFSHSKIQLNGEPVTNDELVRILNTNDGAFVENFFLKQENEQLKILLQNTSDQRDEFHRVARENANRVGKLQKENEQLRNNIREVKAYNNWLVAVLEDTGAIVEIKKGDDGMTEKRFTINTLNGSIDLRDNNEVMTYKQVVDLLNALHEENQALKHQRQESINEIAVIAIKYKALQDENTHFKNLIQEAYVNERTEMGKSVLKQLLEKIE